MTKTNEEYWKARALEAKKLTEQEADKTAAYINEQYRKAMKDIDDRVRLWYQRFAENNSMTMQQAKKVLNGPEIANFRMDLKEYIKRGEALNEHFDPAWMKRLESASAVHHIQRFEMIRIQTQQAMEELYGNQLDAIDDLARSIFENGYYHSLFSIQKKAGTGWSVNAINKDRLEKFIKRPWAPDGEAFSSRIWKNKAKMINELHTALTQGCITGAPVERVAKQMAERLGVGASNAERLLRTEAAHFATEGDIQGYKDTGVKEYQYIAALDHKTCEICAELDEQVIKVSDYEEGVNAPPLHPNCRCTTVPYFDDEFTVGETRAARDENGKTVQIPADMKYSDWLGKTRVGEAEGSHRRSRYRSTEIARKAIESPEYGRKFSALGECGKVQNRLKQAAVDMLNHRSGTKYEDMAFVDSRDGTTKKQTNYTKAEMQVEPTKAMKKMVREAPDHMIISMHNHAESSMPSTQDIETAYNRKYKYEIIACHDGSVYWYKVTGKPNIAVYYSALVSLNEKDYTKENLERFIKDAKDAGVIIEVL